MYLFISPVQSAGLTTLNENDKVNYDEARNNGRVSAGNLKLINS